MNPILSACVHLTLCFYLFGTFSIIWFESCDTTADVRKKWASLFIALVFARSYHFNEPLVFGMPSSILIRFHVESSFPKSKHATGSSLIVKLGLVSFRCLYLCSVQYSMVLFSLSFHDVPETSASFFHSVESHTRSRSRFQFSIYLPRSKQLKPKLYVCFAIEHFQTSTHKKTSRSPSKASILLKLTASKRKWIDILRASSSLLALSFLSHREFGNSFITNRIYYKNLSMRKFFLHFRRLCVYLYYS